MKILIVTLAFPDEPHVYERTMTSIEALTYPPEFPVPDLRVLISDGKVEHPYDDVLVKHQQARRMILDEGYDAMLSIEADMIVPPNALEKLANVDADVVYALYCGRSYAMPLCFPTIDGFKGASIASEQHLDWARKHWGEVVASEGAGFGCTLIHRRVLEKIDFRRDGHKNFADDWHFALDVKEAGFKSAHHFGVLCGHILRNGQVRWPDIDAPGLSRLGGEPIVNEEQVEAGKYLALRRIENPTTNKVYRKGEEVQLDAGNARVLLALGKVARIEKPQQKKRQQKKESK